MDEKRFSQLFDEAQETDEYWAEQARLEFTEELARLLAQQNLTRSELANRLQTSRAYVTKILNGNANFTIETMSRIARALGARVTFYLAPIGKAISVSEVAIDEQDITQTVRFSEAPSIQVGRQLVLEANQSTVMESEFHWVHPNG